MNIINNCYKIYIYYYYSQFIMNKEISLQQHNVLQHRNKKQLFSYTRYSLYFQPSPRSISRCENQINNIKKEIPILMNPISPSSLNIPYSKYPLLKVRSPKHRETKSMIAEDRKKLQRRWIGVPKIDLSQKSNFRNRNIFPKRNKRGSNQLVINMLFKYDKYLAMNDEENQRFSNNDTQRDQQSKFRRWRQQQKDRI